MRLPILLLMLAMTSALCAQKVTDLAKSAEDHINLGNLKLAENDLLSAVRIKKDFVTAYRLLGVVYTKMNNFPEAIKAYEKCFELAPKFSHAAYYECAEAYMKTGEYAKALDYFSFYQSSEPKDFKSDESALEVSYDHRMQRNIMSCKYAKEIDFKEIVETPIPLSELNTSGDDYMPSLSPEGKTMLFTRKEEGKDEDIYITNLEENGGWTKARQASEVNTNLNEGQPRFSSCGRLVYFAACNREDGRGSCDIHQADFLNGATQDQKLIEATFNERSWESQPTVSCDGSILIFASNHENGFGGTDLWMSKLVNGRWSAAQNMGGEINTLGDEEAPYLAPDGVTLYFSSDGHPGLGEADIFRSIFKNGTWSKPENLGRSVNSPYREVGFCLAPDDMEAFFSSARPGGRGGIDLYKVGVYRGIAPQQSMVVVRGNVVNEEGQPLEVTVRVKQQGIDTARVYSRKDGYFSLCLPNKTVYSLVIDKKGYQTYINADYFQRSADNPVVDLNIVLLKGTGPEKPDEPAAPLDKPSISAGSVTVFFESGNAMLPFSEQLKIRALIEKFDDPRKLRVHVVGYADEVGDAAKNLALSNRRAENISYLVSVYGIPAKSITTEGKGEDKASGGNMVRRRVEIFVDNAPE